MIRLGFSILILAASLYAGNLSFDSGMIKGHTEVLGDSTIDPTFKKAHSRLSMDNTGDTLRGILEVNIVDFISDNKKRDANMYETMEANQFSKASFEIKEVVSKGGDSYLIKGALTLHGVTKALNFDGTVVSEGSKVKIKAASMLKMSDFGIKPPKMLFLTVRDQVDVSVDIVLKR